MTITHIIAVAGGGALGAVARMLLSTLIGANAILIINIIGCFAIGSLVSFLALKSSLSQTMSLFLIVGLLGGFTTFSTFSMEAMAMLDTHKYMNFAFYIIISVIGSLSAFVFGRYLVKTFV